MSKVFNTCVIMTYIPDASEIAGTLGPLSGGIIAAIWGYESVFILSITFLLIGGTIVKLFVPEPRHAKISFGD